MRFSVLSVLALAFPFVGGLANAANLPRKTGVSGAIQTGWAPKVTQAPNVGKIEGRRAFKPVRRETVTHWVNNETCGWIAGPSSDAFACGGGATCATNIDHVVACATGTLSPFFTTCQDYSAYQSGSCSKGNPEAGCCTESDFGSCATYLWTGYPARSMLRCSNTSTIITMLDAPQFVVDASLASSSSQSATDVDDASSGTLSDQQSTNAANAKIGAIIGISLGSVVAIVLTIVMSMKFCAYLKLGKEDCRNVRSHLNNAVQVDRVSSSRASALEETEDERTPRLTSSMYSRMSARSYSSVAPYSPYMPANRSVFGFRPSPPGYETGLNTRTSMIAEERATPPPRYSLFPNGEAAALCADQQQHTVASTEVETSTVTEEGERDTK
ncbi:hypothetical protein F5Y11DRAFT_366401 [Daldinia sp. FL1419]|nr:hypothetical protein F5Y11DRAFT_366401 [Daldinia sp. FL1419]